MRITVGLRAINMLFYTGLKYNIQDGCLVNIIKYIKYHKMHVVKIMSYFSELLDRYSLVQILQ